MCPNKIQPQGNGLGPKGPPSPKESTTKVEELSSSKNKGLAVNKFAALNQAYEEGEILDPMHQEIQLVKSQHTNFEGQNDMSALKDVLTRENLVTEEEVAS